MFRAKFGFIILESRLPIATFFWDGRRSPPNTLRLSTRETAVLDCGCIMLGLWGMTYAGEAADVLLPAVPFRLIPL